MFPKIWIIGKVFLYLCMKKKICTNCKVEKQLKDYHKGNGKDGRRAMCAKCCNAKWSNPERWERRNEARRKARKNKEYREREYEVEKSRRESNPIPYLLSVARHRAKKFGLEFSLDREDIILPELCPILEIPMKYNREGLQPNSYSLDRKDNSKGYIKENIWVISHKANSMKNNATKEQLLLFAKNINKLWEH